MRIASVGQKRLSVVGHGRSGSRRFAKKDLTLDDHQAWRRGLSLAAHASRAPVAESRPGGGRSSRRKDDTPRVRNLVGLADAVESSVDRYQTWECIVETFWPQATERGPPDTGECIARTFGHRRPSVTRA